MSFNAIDWCNGIKEYKCNCGEFWLCHQSKYYSGKECPLCFSKKITSNMNLVDYDEDGVEIVTLNQVVSAGGIARKCDVCGKLYTPKRADSKTCGSSCRKKMSRKNGGRNVIL